MLQVKNLKITHKNDLKSLINNLSISLNDAGKLAIIGEEGTGKSTLLKYLADPSLIEDYCSFHGELISDFRGIAYIPQSMDHLQLEQHLSDYIYHDANIAYFDYNYFFQVANQLNFDCDLLEKEHLHLKNLSGGERLKIQLMKALAYHPQLLLLDEPTADLDSLSLDWLESFIKSSPQTIIFISHDQHFIQKVATSILHLELVRKRQLPQARFYFGSYEDYLAKRQQKDQHQRMLAKKEHEELQKREAKFKKIHDSVQSQLRQTKDSTAGRLLAKKMKAVKSYEKRLEKDLQLITQKPDTMDNMAIFFSDISPLAKQKIILDWENQKLDTGQTISLQIKGQDKILIIGKNGLCKSRLMQKIHTELKAKTGLTVSYVPQHYEDQLDLNLTPLDFLGNHDTQKVKTYLASLDFTADEINHSCHQLSGGQKAKLFLAKMVLDKSNVLLLDEPSRHFSPTSQPIVRRLLSQFKGAIICISHDRLLIESDIFELYQLKQDHLIKVSIDR